jgi:hypothetical protein
MSQAIFRRRVSGGVDFDKRTLPARELEATTDPK